MESDSAAPCSLSAHDSAVLQYLFNPLIQSPNQAESCEDKETSVTKEEDAAALDPDTVATVKLLEGQGVHAARNRNYQEAIRLLSEAIEMAPEYSSPYNNRAQVYRLLREYEKSKADLDQAIQYSDPKPNEEPANTRVAKLAYAQRGFLLKGFLDDEEHGQLDLQRAAALGHSLASLETNPFRTLCGEMVSIMMKEQCGIDA